MSLKRRSVFLSLILRHKPSVAGVTLDENGWAEVEAVLAGISKRFPGFDRHKLDEIVATDEKTRYSYSPCGTKIRANQGHSVQVNVDLRLTDPPETLYHGTSRGSLSAIASDGLRKMSRLYVHLSHDAETARRTGARHGQPVVLVINAKLMAQAGHQFYLSANNVWLAELVPPQFIVFPEGTIV